VLIVDINLPRGVWPPGRITRTFPGKDGVVRVVDVTTTVGTLRRPVWKLIILLLFKPFTMTMFFYSIRIYLYFVTLEL
jgi:hypothetical protein